VLETEIFIVLPRLLFGIDWRLEVLRRWLLLHIENILVDFEGFRCSLVDGLVKALKTAWLLLARDVFLLLVVHLFHHWALIHAVRLHIE
jgi:hypothetical protein